jgi:plastocyanin
MARVALSVAGAALVVAVAPALAAQQSPTITARDMPNRFDPPTLTVAAGETVTFANAGGQHNFTFEDGPAYPPTPQLPDEPGWATMQSRTFSAAGTYRYYCEQHGTLTSGMRGTVTVTPAPPPQAPGPSPQPGPGPSPSPGPGGPTPSGGRPAQVRSVSLAAGSFCARRGGGCKRPGVRLRIDLSAPARVTGVLKRRAKRFGRVDLGTVAAGPRTLRFVRTSGGKRLVAGRYSLALSVDGARAETLRFRVR